MIRETLENYQITPHLTENIMREISHLKPATPTGGKPLVPWTIAASSIVAILLLLGVGSQQLLRVQNPYSLDAQAETTIELVDAPIVLNIDTEPNIHNQFGNANIVGPSNNNEQKPDEVLFAAAQPEGEDIVTLKRQWIQSGRIQGSPVWRLLATPESELYVLDPFARLYKLHADGKEWQHIVDGRFFKLIGQGITPSQSGKIPSIFYLLMNFLLQMITVRHGIRYTHGQKYLLIRLI